MDAEVTADALTVEIMDSSVQAVVDELEAIATEATQLKLADAMMADLFGERMEIGSPRVSAAVDDSHTETRGSATYRLLCSPVVTQGHNRKSPRNSPRGR